MIAQRVTAFALAVFILSAPAFAQLGPKDGPDFAPTDLNRVNVAFFNVNAVIGLGLLAVVTLELLTR